MSKQLSFLQTTYGNHIRLGLNIPFQPSETSFTAGKQIKSRASTLRNKCLDVFKKHLSLTADEVATLLGETVLSIRPRITELRKMDLIVSTGERRANDSGLMARVWKAK